MILTNEFIRNLSNIPGWRTDRKIVVFESDDWGSIRMPSRSTYEKLLNAGLNLNAGDGLRYSLYDTLASASDFESLIEALDSYKDFKGTSAVFTALCVVANPDFKKIRESGFQRYYYEPFTETLKRYYGNEGVFDLWKEGITRGVFKPQFHGREHLNVTAWITALNENHRETHLAFNEGIWAFVPSDLQKGLEYEAAFQVIGEKDIEAHEEIIKDGLDLFERLFGYKAEYFVPPNGQINNSLNIVCRNNGIKLRSASKIQLESTYYGRTKRRFHWLGQKDKSGIRYITRNCFFEPSQPGRDWVDSCLSDMRIAFKFHKPAIISTHRVNYIGVHDVSNRMNGLNNLRRLLANIRKTWPDIEFMTTDQLGYIIDGINHS